jgi:hypothetical protein
MVCPIADSCRAVQGESRSLCLQQNVRRLQSPDRQRRSQALGQQSLSESPPMTRSRFAPHSGLPVATRIQLGSGERVSLANVQ